MRLRCLPVWVWVVFYLVTAMFFVFPEIDLVVSRHFFSPGVGFGTNGTRFERLIHNSVVFLLVSGNLGLIALLLFRRYASRFRIGFTAKELVFLLLLLALGPGLIVNVLLKENWGRARPVDLVQFGGSKEYTAAFMPSDQGGRSFSSGHAAASAYWIVAALLLTPRRYSILSVAVAYSLIVSGMRMAAGGHFLSDILASYLIMGIVALALYEIIYPRGYSAH
ncbi:MAG: phosphatase PAP2 family protein [Chromatiaceae bacterium]|nr:phosphatase PAP2 family protein [Chromatiaceae bacterium]